MNLVARLAAKIRRVSPLHMKRRIDELQSKLDTLERRLGAGPAKPGGFTRPAAKPKAEKPKPISKPNPASGADKPDDAGRASRSDAARDRAGAQDENQLVWLLEDGNKTPAESILGLKVEFLGRGSRIEIEEGAVFHNSRLSLGNGGVVRIGKTDGYGIRNTIVDMRGAGRNRILEIGRGTTIHGCRFAMEGEDDLEIRIGRNCLLSSAITFRASDGHGIFDRETGEVINRTRPIVVGSNVWIGAGAVLLKGAVLPDWSIVGTTSLVTRAFSEPFTAIAGNPARVVRSNVEWDRRQLNKIPKGETLAHET